MITLFPRARAEIAERQVSGRRAYREFLFACVKAGTDPSLSELRAAATHLDSLSDVELLDRFAGDAWAVSECVRLQSLVAAAEKAARKVSLTDSLAKVRAAEAELERLRAEHDHDDGLVTALATHRGDLRRLLAEHPHLAGD